MYVSMYVCMWLQSLSKLEVERKLIDLVRMEQQIERNKVRVSLAYSTTFRCGADVVLYVVLWVFSD